MTYALGKGSLRELEGVHPDLVAAVHRTIERMVQSYVADRQERGLRHFVDAPHFELVEAG